MPCHTNQVNRYPVHLVSGLEHQQPLIFFCGIFIVGLLGFFVANVCSVTNSALCSTDTATAWLVVKSMWCRDRMPMQLEPGCVKPMTAPDQAGPPYSAADARIAEGRSSKTSQLPGGKAPNGLGRKYLMHLPQSIIK